MHPEARHLTAPEAQATFEAEENQQFEHEQVVVVAKAEKDATDSKHNLKRHQNAAFKVFKTPLSSYKHKDNLRDIMIALELDDTGTITELVTCIKGHLDHTPAHVNVPHFAGLYLTSCQGCKHVTGNPPFPLVTSSLLSLSDDNRAPSGPIHVADNSFIDSVLL